MPDSSCAPNVTRLGVWFSCLSYFLIVATIAPAQDCDHDGIPDALEAELLSTFAPAWRPDDPDDDFPPLPISWYLAHCELQVYYHPQRTTDYNGTDDPGTLVASTGGLPLTLEIVIPMVKITLPEHYFYRLKFKSPESDYQNGKDPNDPRTWTIGRDRQDCLYGRCTRLDGAPSNYYLVQYYLFFGWNDVDADRNDIGCPIGNHEGDIVCVEFEVRYDSPIDKKIVRAVYHEHGRQVFIDDPSILDYSTGHPVVYLEKENHEALPWRGGCGFVAGTVPQCVGINKYFDSMDVSIFSVPVAGECDDVPTVREHYGRGVEMLITSAINLGERGFPGPTLEAQFVLAYGGLYGHEGTACCDDPFGSPNCEHVDSPPGPPFQAKMWDRMWLNTNGVVDRSYRDGRFPGCRDGTFRAPIVTPACNAKGPYFAECAGALTSVMLDSGGTAGECNPVTYSWTGPFAGGKATGPTPIVQFAGLGTFTVNLEVGDGKSATTCSTSVTVLDTTPPIITCPEDIAIDATNAAGAIVEYTTISADICDANVLLQCVPPSGATFSIGTNAVHCLATDASGNKSSCSFNIVVFGPLGVKQNVLNQLSGLRTAVADKKNGKELDDAIQELAESIDPSHWADQTHLRTTNEKEVFKEDADSIKELLEVIKCSQGLILGAKLQGLVNRIVNSDRLLTLISITEATTAFGTPEKLREANKELAKGDQDIAKSKYENGIEHYRQAWKKAIEAAE
ncbi:MAG TPA: HYR domain-containing protein [Nitrospiraceae bacterium]